MRGSPIAVTEILVDDSLRAQFFRSMEDTMKKLIRNFSGLW
jgi:hypothetical protein